MKSKHTISLAMLAWLLAGVAHDAGKNGLAFAFLGIGSILIMISVHLHNCEL